MGFYEEQQKFNAEIDDRLNLALKKSWQLRVKDLVYQYTKVYAISEKHIRKRILEWAEFNNITIKNDTLMMPKLETETSE